MSRIRTIKPCFWKHEELSALPEATHMLAAALLNYADDYGYFNANIKLIKAECCPIREPSVSIEESLSRLAAIGYLRLGTAPDGKRYGHIVKFCEHQIVNRKTKSKIRDMQITWDDGSACDLLSDIEPAGKLVRADDAQPDLFDIANPGPVDGNVAAVDDSLNAHGVLTEDSVSPPGALTEGSLQERKGREGKGKEGKGRESDSCASRRTRRADSDLLAEEWFGEFWATYPKRHGGNPRKPAFEKFREAVRRGVTVDTILTGVRNYRDAKRMRGEEGTEFVAMAKTWLHQAQWEDYQSPLQVAPPAGSPVPVGVNPDDPYLRPDSADEIQRFYAECEARDAARRARMEIP